VLLARRNLFQDITRLALSISGVALAVMLILLLNGFLGGMYRQIAAYLDHNPGTVVVAQEDVTNLLGATSLLPPGTAAAARSRGATVVPILSQFVILDLHDKNQPVYLVGYDPASGAFGLIMTPEQRWRVYMLPLGQDGVITAYLETLTPLGRLDESIRLYCLILLALGLAGLSAALLGGWAIAGGALRPIARMTSTASTIAHSRDLSHRIATPPHHDELGRLATTFNGMLTSVEAAYQAQQRFVADASHELRAPLTAIQGNLELIRRHPEMPTPDRDEALGEAERVAVRLTRLVADLLALARADAGVALQQRPGDLDAVVLDAFRSARQLAQDQQLALDTLEPVQVIGDADRLKQLLLILLDNALKYTPSGGRVTMGLRQCVGGSEITVQDSGVGIAAADLPRVFERFYRADPARSRDAGGTGLGLPIARWIVEQHRGAIHIDSVPGQGTTVTVSLPTQD
jgi:two-component system OmpR family sensor kinase